MTCSSSSITSSHDFLLFLSSDLYRRTITGEREDPGRFWHLIYRPPPAPKEYTRTWRTSAPWSASGCRRVSPTTSGIPQVTNHHRSKVPTLKCANFGKFPSQPHLTSQRFVTALSLPHRCLALWCPRLSPFPPLHSITGGRSITPKSFTHSCSRVSVSWFLDGFLYWNNITPIDF